MVDHLLVLTALRSRLKTMSAADTGTTTLAATTTGYTRAAGSFITDGFVPGMEVSPTGFTNSVPGVISKVEALAITVEGGRTAEAAASGRRLLVGLPEKRAWENMPFEAVDRRWYVEEDYLPGPVSGISFKELDAYPTYVIRIYGLAGLGVSALYRVSDALLRTFAPNVTMQTTDGHIVRVRSDSAPYRGQVLPESASHALVVVTVPLWVRTANIS